MSGAKPEAMEWTDKTMVQVGFVVSRKLAGLLIGKKGATVKKLKSASKCRHINFGEGSIMPDSDAQLMMIKGNTATIASAVEQASQMIVEFQAEKKLAGNPINDLADGQVECNMLIVDEQVPMVIGRKGSKIKQMQSDHGTKMRFSDQRIGGEQILTIVGTPEQVAACVPSVIRGLPVESWRSDRPLFDAAYGKGQMRPYDPYDDYGRGDPRDYPPRGDFGRFGPPPPRFGGYDDFGPPRQPPFRGPPPGEGEPWTDSTVVSVGFVVPQVYAGLLIGKKGATVKRLTKESGCLKINFGEGTIPGTDMQLMIMKGTTGRIALGVTKVGELMAAFAQSKQQQNVQVTSLPNGVVEMNLLICDTHVAMVIGKKGSKIKSMQNETDTQMKFTEQRVAGEQYLNITGLPENVGRCVDLVVRGLPVELWNGDHPLYSQAQRDDINRGPLPSRDAPYRDSRPEYYPPPRSPPPSAFSAPYGSPLGYLPPPRDEYYPPATARDYPPPVARFAPLSPRSRPLGSPAPAAPYDLPYDPYEPAYTTRRPMDLDYPPGKRHRGVVPAGRF